MKTVIENKTSKEYFEKYEDLAQAFKVSRLSRLVPLVGYNTLQEAFLQDENLNNIPLRLWDNMDFAVRQVMKDCPLDQFLAVYHKHSNYGEADRKKRIWSLSESVSLLKHVAIYHIIGATPVFEA